MSVHRQRSRGTGVLLVGAGDAPLSGVSPPRGTSQAVSWPEGSGDPVQGCDDPGTPRTCTPGGTSARTHP
jgi:hypothetical protein